MYSLLSFIILRAIWVFTLSMSIFANPSSISHITLKWKMNSFIDPRTLLSEVLHNIIFLWSSIILSIKLWLIDSAQRRADKFRLKISPICLISFFVWLITIKENKVLELTNIRHFFLSTRKRFAYHGPRTLVSFSGSYWLGMTPRRSIIFFVQHRKPNIFLYPPVDIYCIIRVVSYIWERSP